MTSFLLFKATKDQIVGPNCDNYTLVIQKENTPSKGAYLGYPCYSCLYLIFLIFTTLGRLSVQNMRHIFCVQNRENLFIPDIRRYESLPFECITISETESCVRHLSNLQQRHITKYQFYHKNKEIIVPLELKHS